MEGPAYSRPRASRSPVYRYHSCCFFLSGGAILYANRFQSTHTPLSSELGGATADLHTARVVSGRSTLAAERLHNMPVHSTNSTIVVTSLHRDCTHHGLNEFYGLLPTVMELRTG